MVESNTRMSSPTPSQPSEHTSVPQSPLIFAYTQTDAAGACRVERICHKPRPKPLRAAGWTEFLATLNVTQKGAAMAPRFSSTQHPTSDTRVDPLPLGGVHLLMSQTVRTSLTEAFLIQKSSTTLWNESNPNSFTGLKGETEASTSSSHRTETVWPRLCV